jgi:tRNA-splicing ligase RtcB
MGTDTFIVEGLGNPASFHSSAHGAGRRMSRTQAKKELSVEDLRVLMGDKVWLESQALALLDESPEAYKSIEAVMRDQADLVRVVTRLSQILNYKGTA